MGKSVTTRLTIWLPEAIRAALVGAAQREGVTVAALVFRALAQAGYGVYEPIRGRPPSDRVRPEITKS